MLDKAVAELQAELQAVAAKRRAIEAALKDVRDELHGAIKAMFAVDPDYPVSQMADITGYAAEHVRRVRDGREPSRPSPVRQRRVTRQDGGAPAPSA
jgi:hypothetical protein